MRAHFITVEDLKSNDELFLDFYVIWNTVAFRCILWNVLPTHVIGIMSVILKT